MITGMNHFTVIAEDERATLDFYVGLLGLTVGPRPDLGFPGAWYAVGDSQELHLIVHPPSKTMRGTPEIDGRDGHFAFRVRRYDETLARLREHGIALIESPHNKTPWAQIYVTDPDGNVIEFNVER